MKTTQRMIWPGAVLIACAIVNSAVAQSQPAATQVAAEDSKSAVTRILEVCSVVADSHVEPPVMQQVVLSAARSIYDLRKMEPPQDLSQRISKLTTSKEFVSMLESIVDESDGVDTNAVIENLLTRIPGGGTLVGSKQARVEAQVSANKYVGVGIALAMVDDRPLITSCFYGGPGFEAGVKSNDIILEIDGDLTAGKTLTEVVTQLRGEQGTDVTLLLKHATAGERKIVVTRDVAFIPTVTGASQDAQGKWIHRFSNDPHLDLLRINSFGASTAHELRKLDSSYGDNKPAGIILDLRAGGGAIHDVVMVADQFLDAGMIGSSTIGTRKSTYKSQDECIFQEIPIVVLTSSTASTSSAFLAAALQDRDRVIVVGEPTRGVSYIRSQFDLANGDKLIIPSGYMRRGNGTILFSQQDPELIKRRAAGLMRDEKFDRKSASVVIPNHVVFTNRNTPSLMGTTNAKNYEDPIMVKAVSVLKELTQQKAEVKTDEKNAAS